MPLKPSRCFEFGSAAWDTFLKDLQEFLFRLVVFLKNVNDLYIEVDGIPIFHVSKELRCRPALSIDKENAVSSSGLFAAGTQASFGDLVILSSNCGATGSAKKGSIADNQRVVFQLLEATLAVQVVNL